MSEHGHGANEPHDEALHSRGGIAPIVWVFIGVTILIVLYQGYNVYSSGGDAHVWPASNAVKVDLPPQH
jgi:hypothetical protein